MSLIDCMLVFICPMIILQMTLEKTNNLGLAILFGVIYFIAQFVVLGIAEVYTNSLER